MSETEFLERKGRQPSGTGHGRFTAGSRRDANREGEGSKAGLFRAVSPIRIPVTRENRSALRLLRAKELEIWDATNGPISGRVEVPKEDRESQFILLLLAAAAAALWLQATSAAVGFVEGWEGFRSWVEWVINSALSAGG